MMKNQIAPMSMERPSDEKADLIGANKADLTAHATGGQEKKGCIQSVGGAITGAINNFFYKLGAFVAKRPWLTILICVLITAGCGAGMLKFQTENRSEKLWVPSATEAQDNKLYVDQFYTAATSRIESVQITAPDDGDVLTPAAFDAAYATFKLVESIEAEDPKTSNGIITYNDYCLKLGPVVCNNWSILQLFDDASAWQTKEAILSQINAMFPATPAESEGTCTPSSGGYAIDQLLGGIERNAETGAVTGAKLISMGFLLQNNWEVSADNTEIEPRAEAWEQNFLDAMEKANDESPFMISYLAGRSFGDAFGAEIAGDTNLLMGGIFAVILYAILNLSRWSEGCSGFRGLLCIGGVLSIGMAIVCSFGICSLIGLAYSPLTSVLPFLVLGIGVDDMFVIVNAYDSTPEHLTVSERIARALAVSGSSVTVTSITDILAFFIGSFTVLPALQWFSIYAAFCILFDYIFQVTFFVSFLVFDSRRRARKSADCLCCCTTPAIACQCCSSGPHDDSSMLYKPEEAPKACCCAPNGFFATDDKTKRALGWMARKLSSWAVKAPVLLLFAGVIAGGAYGFSQIQVKGDVNNFIPPGTSLKTYVEISEQYLNTVGPSVSVYVDLKDVELYDKAVLTSMDELVTKIADDPYISDCSVTAFPKELIALYDSAADKDTFYSSVKAFVQGPTGRLYSNDINFADSDDIKVENIRLQADYVYLPGSPEEVKAMNSLRKVVEDHGRVGQAEAFAYSSDFLTWEGYKEIGMEAVRNVGLALAMVLLVILFLVVHPLGSIITFVNICCVVVEIIGYMHFWGLTIDNVTVIFIVLSLGLCVDYSVHITHTYLHKDGDGNMRMVATLEDMGVAVLNGVTSTWIAVMILSGSTSYVFATFFKALFLCTTLGCLHGLILLPVVLSIVNPATVHAHASHEQEEAQAMYSSQAIP